MLLRIRNFIGISVLILGLFSCNSENTSVSESGHPLLILKKQNVQEIKDGLSLYSMLQSSLEDAVAIADKAILSGVEVPFPKDPGGGYSHEKHKQNYIEMYNAGLVYQLNGQEKYAAFVREMLYAYAELYPKLGLHPMQKNQAPGKLFWQGLNESVWLVYTIQAYDCIYEYLSLEERRHIEDNLLRKVVEFFTVEDSYSFDRVHNHGTWAVAGVGMTGMVLGDSIMIKKALYSTKLDGSGGFLKQIDKLFSPDGYYAEGPYYQRYALMPFMVFAQALENNMPQLKIFEYKDGVLKKAVTTLLQLTAPDGRFFPFNDAIKEKSWVSAELLFGTNIVYGLNEDSQVLDVAKKQGKVMLSKQGLLVAKAIEHGMNDAFERRPMLIHDGSEGDMGGVAMMRMGKAEDQSTLVFKFSSQGMGHGHFDRLAFMLYDNGNEIIPDYGAARFLNVTAKEGGRYLPENTSWAKHTVAHNTLVVNEESNFNGNQKEADKLSPEILFSQLDNDTFQIVSASDNNCYAGVDYKRSMALVQFDERKYIIDLIEVNSQEVASLDLPMYYNGQVITTNFKYVKPQSMRALGSDNGYQHLWLEGEATQLPATSSVTWMTGTGFYTMSFLSDQNTEFYFTRLGANDPDYNLRNLGGMMLRTKAKGTKLLASVIEMHGNYNPISEAVMQSEGSVEAISLVENTSNTKQLVLSLKNKKQITLHLENNKGKLFIK